VKTNPVKVAHYLTTAMDKDEEALFVRIFPIFLIWLRTHLGASLSGGKATAHKPATVVCGLGHNRNKANRCRGPINSNPRKWKMASVGVRLRDWPDSTSSMAHGRIKR